MGISLISLGNEVKYYLFCPKRAEVNFVRVLNKIKIVVFLHSLSLAWFCISHSCKSIFFFLLLIYSLSFFSPSLVHDYTLALNQVAVFFPLSVPSLLCMILHLALHSHFNYCPYLVRIYLLCCLFSPSCYHMQLFCISQPTTFNYFVGNDKTNIKYGKNINQPTLICLDVKWHTRSI